MASAKSEFYKLHFNNPAGKKLLMEEYKDKVVLIVNTATQCGLTPQFKGLERLHTTYKEKGLIVLGTPCNQFNKQEPLSNEEMEATCLLNHGVSFQLTEKVKVNGSDTHPVYKYLKSNLGSLLGRKIKWNFTKFLIDRNGTPYKRFAPTTSPKRIESEIKRLLLSQ